MSAIFGIVRLDVRPADPAWLAAMSDALAGCGPHGDGVWQGGGVALGARILHDTPEAAGERQPWIGRESGAVLVADARLDNRDELLAALDVARDGDDPVPDGALILAAWERWGAECCARLEGDYAFAVWDPRARRLFLARRDGGKTPLLLPPLGTGAGLRLAARGAPGARRGPPPARPPGGRRPPADAS